jgi:hypothetical protein
MRSPFTLGAVLLVFFFVVTFAVALFFNRSFPLSVIAGENNVGTWMSGFLLIFSATICLIMGIKDARFPWLLLFGFFLCLAADEQFMIHEFIKQRIIFLGGGKANTSRWLYELPVLIGTCVGMVMIALLWKVLHGNSRTLLVFAASLGTLSVLIDIFAMGAFWEDTLKVFAELSITLSLLDRVTH